MPSERATTGSGVRLRSSAARVDGHTRAHGIRFGELAKGACQLVPVCVCMFALLSGSPSGSSVGSPSSRILEKQCGRRRKGKWEQVVRIGAGACGSVRARADRCRRVRIGAGALTMKSPVRSMVAPLTS